MKEEIIVFLSRPNLFIYEQQLFINKLQEKLSVFSIKTITLQADNYDIMDSLNYLKASFVNVMALLLSDFAKFSLKRDAKKEVVGKILYSIIQRK